MSQVGFDNEKYLTLQSKHIHQRIEQFGGKLYLEFGGKLFDDFHASRVLPGFAPDSKLRMLTNLKNEAEIVIVINAADIEKNKIRGDLGITYDLDVLRLIDIFREKGFYVGSVIISQYSGQANTDAFKKRLENRNIKVYLHYPINGYPANIPLIVSDDGYGKNEYIETTRPLVVVTAPGPGSGKMATCLSQLYHENKRGIKAGYAKFETFPIWNLPLKHPVNLAYEAATADLNDVNMIDPFHLEAYGETTVNYNRDVEIFPVLNTILEKISGESPYKSPTDMGVNMAGNCIIDDEVCCYAAEQEIIRRYYEALCARREGKMDDDAIYKIELLMNNAKVTKDDRLVIPTAVAKSKENDDCPAAAIELPDDTIVAGKSSNLLTAISATLLNALKKLAKLDDSVHLIPPSVIEPVIELKEDYLNSAKTPLYIDETLLALSVSASLDENAKLAMYQLTNLKGTDLHSTIILSSSEKNVLKKLGINVTCEPWYETNNIYQVR